MECFEYISEISGALNCIEKYSAKMKEALDSEYDFYKKLCSAFSVAVLELKIKDLYCIDVPEGMEEEHEIFTGIINRASRLIKCLASVVDGKKSVEEFDSILETLREDMAILDMKLSSLMYSDDEEWLNMQDIGLEITD